MTPDAELVAETLKGWGPAGAVISVLLAVISALVAAIIFLYRNNNKLNASRLLENGNTIKLGEGWNSSIAKMADAIEERNQTTIALVDAIKEQATALQMVDQRIGFYHDGNTDKIKELQNVVAALADALRVNTGIVTEVRNSLSMVAQSISDAKIRLETIAATSRRRP